MEIKETTKRFCRIKTIKVENGKFMDEDGETIDLAKILTTVYGNGYFTLTTTCKSEEDISVEEDG